MSNLDNSSLFDDRPAASTGPADPGRISWLSRLLRPTIRRFLNWLDRRQLESLADQFGTNVDEERIRKARERSGHAACELFLLMIGPAHSSEAIRLSAVWLAHNLERDDPLCAALSFALHESIKPDPLPGSAGVRREFLDILRRYPDTAAMEEATTAAAANGRRLVIDRKSRQDLEAGTVGPIASPAGE